MNLRPPDTEEPTLNLTPLIDVVFLMLIFFVVTTTFAPQQAQLSVDLPTAREAESTAEAPLVVSVNADGEYAVGSAAVDGSARLAQVLAEALDGRDPATVRVLLRADAAATHGRVAAVLDAAQALGIEDIGIATRNTP